MCFCLTDLLLLSNYSPELHNTIWQCHRKEIPDAGFDRSLTAEEEDAVWISWFEVNSDFKAVIDTNRCRESHVAVPLKAGVDYDNLYKVKENWLNRVWEQRWTTTVHEGKKVWSYKIMSVSKWHLPTIQCPLSPLKDNDWWYILRAVHVPTCANWWFRCRHCYQLHYP